MTMNPCRRPWHVKPPWPQVTTTEPPTHAELGKMVTAALERQTRRKHGCKS